MYWFMRTCSLADIMHDRTLEKKVGGQVLDGAISLMHRGSLASQWLAFLDCDHDLLLIPQPPGISSSTTVWFSIALMFLWTTQYSPF